MSNSTAAPRSEVIQDQPGTSVLEASIRKALPENLKDAEITIEPQEKLVDEEGRFSAEFAIVTINGQKFGLITSGLSTHTKSVQKVKDIAVPMHNAHEKAYELLKGINPKLKVICISDISNSVYSVPGEGVSRIASFFNEHKNDFHEVVIFKPGVLANIAKGLVMYVFHGLPVRIADSQEKAMEIAMQNALLKPKEG